MRPYKGQPSTGVLFFGPESDDQELKRRNPGLTYFRFAPYGMDIQINPHIKGEGIAAVLNYLGIPKEEAIGFGDDYQDMSMADACSAFVCMGNGKEEVKKVATLVAPRIEENGLAVALKKLGCI